MRKSAIIIFVATVLISLAKDFTVYTKKGSFDYKTSDVDSILFVDQEIEFPEIPDPEIGDYIYEDGTWGKDLNRDKNIIGIVCSLDPTAADRARGFVHGYAMCPSMLCCYKDLITLSEVIPSWGKMGQQEFTDKPIPTTIEEIMADRDGLTNTLEIYNRYVGNQYAFDIWEQCADYAPFVSVRLFCKDMPKNLSGYFIPTAGQFMEMLQNLGGFTTNYDMTWNYNDYTEDVDYTTYIWKQSPKPYIDKVNEYLKPVNEVNYFWTVMGGIYRVPRTVSERILRSKPYVTSTECGKNNFWYFHPINGEMKLITDDREELFYFSRLSLLPKDESTTTTYYYCRIWPFLAF